jgi:transketolase N-terminal domain/subunit
MAESQPDAVRLHRIRTRALRLRLASVRAVRAVRWGFLGSCLSVCDLLAVLAEAGMTGHWAWEYLLRPA